MSDAIAICTYCGKEIIGGKGNWWHRRRDGGYGEMRCRPGDPEDGAHAQPSLIPGFTSSPSISAERGESVPITPDFTVEIRSIESVTSRDACIVRMNVHLRIGSEFENHMIEGTAKRSPEDKPNSQVARRLALGRAFSSLGKTLERQANGLVKHADDIREMRKNAKPKPPQKKAAPKKKRAKSDKTS